MFLATSGLIWKAIAKFVRGPRASTEISPGLAIIVSAINCAAVLSICLPCTPIQSFIYIHLHVIHVLQQDLCHKTCLQIVHITILSSFNNLKLILLIAHCTKSKVFSIVFSPDSDLISAMTGNAGYSNTSLLKLKILNSVGVHKRLSYVLAWID